MVKMALLIGVSEYESGLPSLPAAVKDAEAMRQVLKHPEIGNFDEVRTLPNPDPLVMQESIETLFSGRSKDDLILLFFSGHGIKDESGRLYLATCITRKNPQGELLKSTAVSASFVQDIMCNSRCRRQVVILDCCFSGAFAKGWLAKDDGSVDINNQLGGEGKVVLTSSTHVQYSFEQQGSDLSTYTRYLVEGIETGAADRDNDGVISIDELHEYAKGKVQQAAPAMKPEIYAVKEAYKIRLAKAPMDDPKLRYRQEVERYKNRGEISFVGRRILDELQENLGILPEEAAAIEAEVLKPYKEYQQKLQRYEQALADAMRRENPLSDYTRTELKRYQEILNLRDEDIAPIEEAITSQKESVQYPEPVIGGIKATINSHGEDLKSANFLGTSVAASQSETPVITRIGLPSILSTSVRVLRNPKAIIGIVAGISTALVLTVYFSGKPQNSSVTSQPKSPEASTSTSASRNSPTGNMSAQELYDRGVDKYKKKDFKGAIEDFNHALDLDANNLSVDIYNQRGYSLLQLGKYTEAINDLNQYIQDNPNEYYSRSYRASAYYKLGKYQQSIDDYSKALEINSNDVNSYFNRGNAYYQQGKYEKAASDYSRAIALNYDPLGDAYYGRGNTYSQRGDKQNAIKDYQKAAELYEKQGKTKEYKNVLDKIKENKP
jgi:tetratricopeptide (TPR) repeat protein